MSGNDKMSANIGEVAQKKYCVIGKSLPHTLSPEIHRAFGNGNYGVRELADTAELARFVRERGFAGYNVTIPYKQEIIPLLDGLSEEAEKIGAVNTVVCESGRLVGFNTDADGMSFALRDAKISLAGKNILILGSGGTCQTAKYVCAREGAVSVSVVSRRGEINYDSCYDLKDTQVIINTTPVGMMPNAYRSPVDVGRFEMLEGVFDCVYNPLETLLVKNARAKGVRAANGLLMLTEQARVAHNLYSRVSGLAEAGEDMTKSVAENLARSRRNIVLIGMAGSGKTTIGKRLAKRLNRQFIDTDREVEALECTSIPDIFARKGEGYFRESERTAVESACTRQGLVIAAGGGAVLNEENVFFMKANGICVLINRDPKELATGGRPLSNSAEKAKALYEKRKPIYFAAADIMVENDADIEDAVDRILNLIGEI